ncbi:MAG: 2'-5' RNA ligase family protein [Candidatus Nanoarchaeia archaeon]
MEKIQGRYFIAILPDESTGELVRNLRENYADMLEIPKTPIHSTLRESFFTSKIDDCIHELEQFCKDINQFNVQIQRYDIFSEKHLVLKIEANPELQLLHENIMKISQPFVENIKQYLPLEELSNEQNLLLKKYNNPYCFEFYNPHISVGNIVNNKDLETIKSDFHKLTFDSTFKVNFVAIVDKQKNEVYYKIKLK